MLTRPSLRLRHTPPIVTVVGVMLLLAAVGAGVWIGSIDRTPSPRMMDRATAADALFLPTLDAEPERPADAARGAALFAERCARCHTIGGRGTSEGPDLVVAALRRDPEWVRAMTADPDSMFRTDSLAQWVLEVHDIDRTDVTAGNTDLVVLGAFLAAFDRTR